MAEALAGKVAVARQFLRSIRLDADYGREDAFRGYALQGSARSALDTLATQVIQTQQRAFTWTGPYGSGKSSLALALCSLVHPDARIRKSARDTLALGADSPLNRAFSPGREGWLVVPLVGQRGSVQAAIAEAIEPYLPKRRSAKGRGSVVSELVTLAESDHRGVLVVLDELGKFLEHAALTGEDIYFYQELAEAASRAKGTLVVIGVLHQAFEQYATRLGRETRDEWAKIQGRWVDIPLLSPVDETIALIGQALDVSGIKHADSRAIADSIAKTIKQRRPGSASDLSVRLDRCWPLHPVTACLLGPSAKRRFGQNERSVFGFLGSVEPMGFRDWLNNTPASPDVYYWPAQYWDYLRANLEPAILASSDGHRWAIGAEAVERAEARGDARDVTLVKTIALIELFRNGSGVLADEATLQACLSPAQAKGVRAALVRLAEWSIIIYRKHLGGWGLYAGSDFDIHAALSEARETVGDGDMQVLSNASDLYPVLAKRLYQETGAMRWFSRTIVRADQAKHYLRTRRTDPGSCGEFLLVIPERDTSPRSLVSLAKSISIEAEQQGLVIGIPANGAKLIELGNELGALKYVQSSRPELQGDSVARREVEARVAHIRGELDEALRDAFFLARWFYQGELLVSKVHHGLAPLAADVAAAIYPNALHVSSELINRDQLSSSAARARRDLLYRMLSHNQQEHLGYDGFPADAGLYYTTLQASGLHRRDGGEFKFAKPVGAKTAQSFQALWQATDDAVQQARTGIGLDQVYALWSAPPFGVKQGLLPIIALAYFLANRSQLTFYVENVFSPELTETAIDEWLQDPKRIAWRYVPIAAAQKRMLLELSTAVNERITAAPQAEALDSARALVAVVLALPPWSKRTTSVPETVQAVRQLLLKASDPHKVLFTDLPATLDRPAGVALANQIADMLATLTGAYPAMLKRVERALFSALDHHADLAKLRQRGQIVSGLTGDFRLDAFATRIAAYQGSHEDIEGIVALAVNKPSRDWVDRDIDAALLQIGSWALDFRRAETMATLKDRPATRRAFAVVFGSGDNGKTVSGAFDVSIDDATAISDLAKNILAQGIAGAVRKEVFLAALAEAGIKLVEQDHMLVQENP